MYLYEKNNETIDIYTLMANKEKIEDIEKRNCKRIYLLKIGY